MLLPADGDRRDVVEPAGRASAAARSADHHAAGSTSVPSGCGARPSRTSAPVSASRTTTLHDWVERSTPATSGTCAAGSAGAEQVLDRELVEPREAVAALGGLVDVEVLEGVRSASRSS